VKKFIGLIVTAITSIVLYYGFSAQKYKGSLGFGVGAATVGSLGQLNLSRLSLVLAR